MLSQNQAKWLNALAVKKYRQKYRNFIVEGDKMVVELLQCPRFGIVAVFGLERWAEAHAALLQPFFEKFNPVTEAELRKVSTLTTPNAVLAVAELPVEEPEFPLWNAQTPAIYLDGLQDPGNAGTILRTADWFGMHTVFCSPDSVDLFSPKVVQATMGAIFRVKTQEIELPELLARHSGLPVLGAVLEGDSIKGFTWPDNGLLVIGNEGRGIRPEHLPLLTHRISIPKHPNGGAESLNAAIATGILMSHWQK
ncbi:MAG: RNA methyltransferase [Saprospiraceae bacterium]|nr:RNA methyltransferase [Saprospiraceae bacterium]